MMSVITKVELIYHNKVMLFMHTCGELCMYMPVDKIKSSSDKKNKLSQL